MFVKKLSQIPVEAVSAGKHTFKQVLIGAPEAPNFTMRRFIIEQDGFMPKHTNTVEHEQIVLRGRARIGIGDKEFIVEKDDVVYIPAGTVHWYQNISPEPFEFLCVIPNQEDKIQIIEE